MTAAPDDWERWRETWREGGAAPPPVAEVQNRFKREQRRIVLTTAAEIVLALASAVGIAAALVHTPSGFPATWGAVVLVVTSRSRRPAIRRSATTSPARLATMNTEPLRPFSPSST